MKLICFVFLCFAFVNGFGQSSKINNKLSVKFGYGGAGSFFVRSYDENQVPMFASFYKKKFIGSNLAFGLTFQSGKRSGITMEYTRQQFARRIMYTYNPGIYINSNIRHINNFFELIYDRKLSETKKNNFGIGLGIYYVTFQQEEVDVWPGGIIWEERNFKNNGLEEGGVLIEVAYEYKFQPKVNIGIKTQFYYTLTAPEPESITLYPYIKIFFGK